MSEDDRGASISPPFAPAAYISGGLLGLTPLLAYPGNWTSNAPTASSAQATWVAEADLVCIGLAASIVLFSLALVAILRTWRGQGQASQALGWRQGLSDAVLTRRNRSAFVVPAIAYTLFFAIFTGLVGIAPGGDIAASGSPSASEVLCCGPVGITPGLVVVLSPYLQLTANPLTILLGFAGALLFALNIGATVAAVRLRTPSVPRSATGIVGAFGAFLVSCPSCGTILLVNALEGTAASAFLLGWTAYQVPLLLLAFPLGLVSLYVMGRSLANPHCKLRPRRKAPRASREELAGSAPRREDSEGAD